MIITKNKGLFIDKINHEFGAKIVVQGS